MIHERFIKVINAKLPRKGAFTQLEQLTGINARSWGHAYNGRTQPGAEHLEQLCRLFPEYTRWLMTGQTRPEMGDTSPDLEQLEALKKSIGG
jgi:hypothetical protein